MVPFRVGEARRNGAGVLGTGKRIIAALRNLHRQTSEKCSSREAGDKLGELAVVGSARRVAGRDRRVSSRRQRTPGRRPRAPVAGAHIPPRSCGSSRRDAGDGLAYCPARPRRTDIARRRADPRPCRAGSAASFWRWLPPHGRARPPSPRQSNRSPPVAGRGARAQARSPPSCQPLSNCRSKCSATGSARHGRRRESRCRKGSFGCRARRRSRSSLLQSPCSGTRRADSPRRSRGRRRGHRANRPARSNRPPPRASRARKIATRWRAC